MFCSLIAEESQEKGKEMAQKNGVTHRQQDGDRRDGTALER